MENAVYLKGLTPETQWCIGSPRLQITRFPFRVGRDSRVNEANPAVERRRRDSKSNNDLYLRESGDHLNVSREHFQIEHRGTDYYIVDRGSTRGTLVEGTVIGKSWSGGEQRLTSGDVIIVGGSESKHVFKFVLE